ncbi:serine/threonine-protein kinase [Paraliomyxa miuraensis]|uniref:serine/threonine-protein kinase n=1 Tax=Paraliomyxa miuraensis TaxID=376150 RepID=UPI002257EA95|nr:serine/threonine-protein kinase [Paraliomyxa miuraensis]MCX4246314.1 serine/threonine protein kinase [Paraliomyxa miuraensis]
MARPWGRVGLPRAAGSPTMAAVPPTVPDLPALPERFTEVELLGRGAQAITVAAHDTALERWVAIKVLDLGRISDWKVHERFERERAVLESLRHPGIPAYLGHLRDEERGQSLLVLELVEGRTLAEDLASGRRRSEAELLELLMQLLDVLEYLHGLHPPVIHRDIKPGNVIVRPDGRAVLVDFGGVTKAFRPTGESSVGTFGYMAPEQLHGRSTPASDLHALAATLAALAAGEDADALPRKGLEVDLGAVMAPGRLRTVLQAMLRADPDQRLGSVAEVRARLARGEPQSDRESLALEPSQARTMRPANEGPGSVAAVWQGLTQRQRIGMLAYFWVSIGLCVVTRAFILLVLLLVSIPVLVGTLYWFGRDRKTDEE